MTPPLYDWRAEEIDDRRRFLEAAAVVVVAVAALLLAGLGVGLLVTGRFAGWVTLALAGALALTPLMLARRPEGDR